MEDISSFSLSFEFLTIRRVMSVIPLNRCLNTYAHKGEKKRVSTRSTVHQHIYIYDVCSEPSGLQVVKAPNQMKSLKNYRYLSAKYTKQ